MRALRLLATLLAALNAPADARVSSVPSSANPPGPLADVSIEQRLDQPLPLDAVFRDESGAPVRLGSYFGARPVVLAFVYYRCPMLCPYLLNGLVRAFRAMPYTAGKDFEVVTLSIDPLDSPAIARVKKQDFVEEYGRPGAERGIHFLTGEEPAIRKAALAAGFRYAKDPETGEFAHAAGIMVVTPSGRMSRYLFGVEYAPRDLRLALVEASRGGIGSAADRVLLYCFHYDPKTGKYSLAILRLVRAAGVTTAVLVAAVLIVLFRRGADAPPRAPGP